MLSGHLIDLVTERLPVSLCCAGPKENHPESCVMVIFMKHFKVQVDRQEQVFGQDAYMPHQDTYASSQLQLSIPVVHQGRSCSQWQRFK